MRSERAAAINDGDRGTKWLVPSLQGGFPDEATNLGGYPDLAVVLRSLELCLVQRVAAEASVLYTRKVPLFDAFRMH
jgi:hypothetical protein